VKVDVVENSWQEGCGDSETYHYPISLAIPQKGYGPFRELQIANEKEKTWILRNEIMTVQDLADILKVSRRQVYEMTRTRGQVRPHLPLPVLRINGNLRFRRTDIEKWLDQLAEEGRNGN
jgi:predicted DNA-binding transcriptional regulator AlpA